VDAAAHHQHIAGNGVVIRNSGLKARRKRWVRQGISGVGAPGVVVTTPGSLEFDSIRSCSFFFVLAQRPAYYKRDGPHGVAKATYPTLRSAARESACCAFVFVACANARF